MWVLFPPVLPTSEPSHLYFASIEEAVRQDGRGLGSSEGGPLACEWDPSESPVSIQEGFPCPGAKRNRPQDPHLELKQRMTSLRFQSAKKSSRAKPASMLIPDPRPLAPNTKLRSTDVERFTPKFLKKLGNPAFSKTRGRRFPSPLYQVAFD